MRVEGQRLVGWDKVALDRRPTTLRAVWREMVGLRPKRFVPPYNFRVAATPACSLRICENLRNLWTNNPIEISHTLGRFYPQITQIFTDSENLRSPVSRPRLGNVEYSSDH